MTDDVEPLGAEVAAASIHPGDEVLTVGAHVVRCVEKDEDGFLGVRRNRDGTRELTQTSWGDVLDYVDRDRELFGLDLRERAERLRAEQEQSDDEPADEEGDDSTDGDESEDE